MTRPHDLQPLMVAAVAGLAVLAAAFRTPTEPAGHSGREACASRAEQRATAEMLFGRNIGNVIGVTEGDFQAFLDEEVTPRFPDGFTVIDTSGQYRSGEGAIVREPGKLLLIALPARGTGTGLAGVDETAEAYKRRFRQESVGIIIRSACVAF